MRIGIQVTLRDDADVEIRDAAGGDLVLTIRDTATFDYVTVYTSRERMRRFLLAAVEQLQAYTPEDLSEHPGRLNG